MNSPQDTLQAAIVTMDGMSSKMFEVLLKQNGYVAQSFVNSQIDVRAVKGFAKNLLVFNVDPIPDDKDLFQLRMKSFRELCRSDDLSEAKIVISSKNPDDPKTQSLLTVNKLDALVSLPLDAMDFTNIIQPIKNEAPKRTVWRSSWK